MPIGTIFTGFKIFGFIGKAFNFVGAMLAKALELVVKYPVQAFVIVALCVGAWFLNSWAYDRGVASKTKEIAELREQVAQFQQQASERQLKIDELEAQSTAKAEQAEKDLKLANEQFVAVVNDYEKKLRDAKKNPTIKFQTVYVEVPGKAEPIKVEFEDGVQVCKQYPSGYAQTVNDLVRIANDTMSKGVAP